MISSKGKMRFAVAIGLLCCVSPAPAQDKPAGSSGIPKVARPSIGSTMTRHGKHAGAITRAVVLSDDAAIVEHTTELLDEPKPAMPIAALEDALNAQFPPEWFTLDAKSRSALEKLRNAAGRQDDRAIITAFSDVVVTCRNCHRSLRDEKRVPTKAMPPQK